MNIEQNYNDDKRRIERIGEIAYNKHRSKMSIIEYNNCKDISIQFEDGYISRNKYYRNFLIGEIASPYDKTICNHGFIGEGVYTPAIYKDLTVQYDRWYGMLRRCYDPKYQAKQPTYIGCSVSEEWLNFQNFAKWYDENYYEIEGHKMHLDKDILYKGNKIYSPENCVFVPDNINLLFIKCNKARGKYPIGVNQHYKKYKALCGNGEGKQILLGRFDTPLEAFYVYKEYKENILKVVANKYKEQIPEKLYIAMINYKVELTD